jgi:hypothetical protein
MTVNIEREDLELGRLDMLEVAAEHHEAAAAAV